MAENTIAQPEPTVLGVYRSLARIKAAKPADFTMLRKIIDRFAQEVDEQERAARAERAR